MLTTSSSWGLVIVECDDKLCTKNNKVFVLGADDSVAIDFQEKLTNLVQLLYKDRYQGIMFKCHCFDISPLRKMSVKQDNGLLLVNTNK